ncbi:hypothetical protein L1987_02780 [Smallanthus sonchifolius]|uniref:Uncharacterized protein n=1 Tax=Smallanthus sonchifolius TaxID=185202 RepID=A0ACB9K8T5_9ASTR|nr:hypothetical protein L1987_02780 [Smallanthus sonchifolius]
MDTILISWSLIMTNDFVCTMKRTMSMPAQPLDISSDDDDDLAPSNVTKHLAVGKRPKTELTVINPTKKVAAEGLG